MNKSQVTLERMRTFVRVVERGSLSAVARDLGIGQASVSRHVQELEQAVGIPLLSRTTRRVTLTEEGAGYYANCIQILRLVEQAGEEALSARGAASGTIRVSCSAALGVLHITRLIFAFQDRYPDIHIDLSLTDERIDLVGEGVDIALRLGPLTDSSMRLRALGQSQRLMVAAPAYLARWGRPKAPRELRDHQCIRMSNISGSDMLLLSSYQEEWQAVPFDGTLRVDHGLAAREALVAGPGLGAAHRWLVEDLLAEGRLEPILSGWTPSPVPLNMLILPERGQLARVRLLIDFLCDQIATLPGLERSVRGD